MQAGLRTHGLIPRRLPGSCRSSGLKPRVPIHRCGGSVRIDELPVVDDTGRPVGLIDVQDLLRLRIVE